MKYTITALFFHILSLNADAQYYHPCDKYATHETKELYVSMHRLVGAGIMFGHHDDIAYGVNWKFNKDSSDVKSTSGAYPAVYGWDLAKIEHDSLQDINRIPFQLQKKLVKEIYLRGGINTFCWHMDNPVNSKSAWDTTQRTIAAILPGGSFHSEYVTYLDRAAKYLSTLKGNHGEAIPILFRPFHELTGNWFWWGKNKNTPDEFKALWIFTIDYLRINKKLHNLLIVYSVADFDSEADFLERYPGDDYADFVGFDNYCTQDISKYENNLHKRLALLDIIAAKHHKLSCLAETGFLNIPLDNWWTKILLPKILKSKISYVLTWRNAGIEQYFVPFPHQQSADNFRLFKNNNLVIFQDRLSPLAVYGKLMD